MCLAPSALLATDRVWTGATDTSWGTNTNWTGGHPSAGDNAVFNGSFTNQPGSVSASAGGVWMTGTVGQNVTISGTLLTLGSNTINGTAGLGILVDNSTSYTLTINAPLKLGYAQTWRNSSGNLLTIGGAVNNNGNSLTTDGSGNTSISGILSGSGALTKTGSGTLTLNGANTYTGGTNLNAGLVALGNSSALSTSGTISFGGGTLQYSASNTTDYSNRFSTGTNQAYSIDTNSQNVTFATALTSSGGSMTKNGAGTLTLSGSNTYTGGTNINGGTLALGSSGAIGSSGTVSFGGGTLQYSASNTTDYSSRFSTAANQGYNIDTNSQNVTFATALTSSGGSLTKSGSGTLTLSAANTYTGGTTISGGTLQLSGSGTLGSTTGSLAVNSGTLDLNGTNQTIGALSGAGGTILNNSTGTAKTLTIGQGNGSGSYYGAIADHASGTGTISLTKTGSGTETLTGSNTFTGATIISGGTLTLANVSGRALGSTTSVTVNSTGTLLLGASDQINTSATMTLAGGTFAKGAYSEGGTGAIGIGALTLTADSHIDFGTSTVGALTFASLTANAHMITVDNWTGTYNHVGSASTDRLIFDSDQSSNLNDFYFTGYGAGGVEFSLGNGFFEVVAAVPETSTSLYPTLAILLLIVQQLRARTKKRRASGTIGSPLAR